MERWKEKAIKRRSNEKEAVERQQYQCPKSNIFVVEKGITIVIKPPTITVIIALSELQNDSTSVKL